LKLIDHVDCQMGYLHEISSHLKYCVNKTKNWKNDKRKI